MGTCQSKKQLDPQTTDPKTVKRESSTSGSSNHHVSQPGKLRHVQPQDAEFEKKERAYYQTIYKLENRIKELKNDAKKISRTIQGQLEQVREQIQKGTQLSIREAKMKTGLITRLKKQLENNEVRIKLLEKKKIDVQMHKVNQDTIEAIQSANLANSKDLTERLDNVINQGIEQRNNQNLIDTKLRNQIDSEIQQQAEQYFNQLLKESKKIQVAKKNVNVSHKKVEEIQKDQLELMLQAL